MDPDTQPPASPDTTLTLTVDITYACSERHYSVAIIDTDGTEIDGYRASFTIGRETPDGHVITVDIHNAGAPDNKDDVEINLGAVRFEPCEFSTYKCGDDGSKKVPTPEQIMAAAFTQNCTVKIVSESGEYSIVIASPMLKEGEAGEEIDDDEAKKIFGEDR